MPEIFPSLLQFEKKKKKHGGVPGPLFSHTSSGPFFVGKKLGGCLPIKKSSPGGNSSSSPSLYTWQYLWPRDFFVGDFGSGCIIWWWYIFTREWKGWNPVCWVKSRISFHSFNICIYIYIYLYRWPSKVVETALFRQPLKFWQAIYPVAANGTHG